MKQKQFSLVQLLQLFFFIVILAFCAATTSQTSEASANTLEAIVLDGAETLGDMNEFNVENDAYGATNTALGPQNGDSPCKICEIDCYGRSDIFKRCGYRYVRYACRREQYCISLNDHVTTQEFYFTIAFCMAFAKCELTDENYYNPAKLDSQNTKLWTPANPNFKKIRNEFFVVYTETNGLTWTINPESWNKNWWHEWMKHRILLSFDPTYQIDKSDNPIPPLISPCFFVYMKVATDLKILYERGTFHTYSTKEEGMRAYFAYVNRKHLENIPWHYRIAWKCGPLATWQSESLISQLMTSQTTRFHEFYELAQECMKDVENKAESNKSLRSSIFGETWAWNFQFYPHIQASINSCALKIRALANKWLYPYEWDVRHMDLVTYVMFYKK